MAILQHNFLLRDVIPPALQSSREGNFLSLQLNIACLEIRLQNNSSSSLNRNHMDNHRGHAHSMSHDSHIQYYPTMHMLTQCIKWRKRNYFEILPPGISRFPVKVILSTALHCIALLLTITVCVSTFTTSTLKVHCFLFSTLCSCSLSMATCARIRCSFHAGAQTCLMSW